MILVLLIFTLACVVALVAGRVIPGARWLTTTAVVAIVYVVGLNVWWYALYFQVIPVYRALAALNVHRIEGVFGGLIFFGPPIVPAAAVLVIALVRLLRHRGR